jgi:DnaK suppressor protein
MKSQDLERYKKKLLDIRQRTRTEITRMMDVVLDDSQSSGEHDHKASEAIDKEVVLENTEEHIRNAVAEALQRIENGDYGVCQDCGKNVLKARLDAIPYTPYCVDCERRHEA